MSRDSTRRIKREILWSAAFVAAIIVSSWLTNLIVPSRLTDQPPVGEAAVKFNHRCTLNYWVGILVLVLVWSAFVCAQHWWQSRRSKLPGVLTPKSGPAQSGR
jgi:hypothetical protein